MVGFADKISHSNDFISLIRTYCMLTRNVGETLYFCDEDGEVYGLASDAGIVDQQLPVSNVDEVFENLSQLLQHAKGSIVRTTTKLLYAFDAPIEQFTPGEQIPIHIYPVFQSKTSVDLYAVVIGVKETSSTRETGENRIPDHRLGPTVEQAATCVVDARTGLFLEANQRFQEVVRIDKSKLMRSRCEEIGLKDLLLLATLNANRRCFFSAQFYFDQTKRWFLSESVKLADRECLKIWCPDEHSIPETPQQGSELAKAFCHNWQDKPEQVLICDDNELLVDTCSSIMDWAKINHDIASNGKEALQLLECKNYDCVFLDLNMPTLNGFDTARLVRQSKRNYRNVPIIAMTATPLSKRDLATQLKHFDSILQKPFDIEDIKTSVMEARIHLQIKRNVSLEASSPNTPAETADDYPQRDYEPTSFMLQFAHREDILEDLRKRILDNLESNLAFLKTLHPQKDRSQLASVIQRSQSMAMSIGAWKVATQAAQLLHQIEQPDHINCIETIEALMTCYEEALCYYNTLDWERFLEQAATVSQIAC